LYNYEYVDSLDVSPLLNEVNTNDGLFGSLPLRTSYKDSPHHESEDILLRGPSISGKSKLDLQNEIQCINYDTFDLFPEIYEHVLDLMSLVRGEQLGRVVITKLPPKGKIHEHIDEGDAGDFYTRYHTVLQSGEGSIFKSGDETIKMEDGGVYYVNNHVLHSVVNNSEVQRIHLICDIQ